VDPSSQVNNFGSAAPPGISATTSATFQIAAGDLSYTMNTTPFGEREFGNKVWAPAFETGYQLYDFFDLFYGFSWFSATNTISKTNTGLVGTPSGTTIIDTFPFSSDDTTAWPIFNFNSSTSVINGDAFNNYHLSTNSPLRGVYPNRQFVSSIPVTVGGVPVAPISVTEVLTNTADISVYETRFGGRTWTPLFGMGRLGATLGASFMPSYYRIAGNRNYTDEATGLSVLSESTLYQDWHAHYGAFVGGDLALSSGSAFLNASWDYTWANAWSFQLYSVTTNFNPGGMTAGLAAGFRF